MGFIDEVSKYNVPRNMCKVKLFLDNQISEELKESGFTSKISDKDVREAHARHTISSVLRALKDRGFVGGEQALTNHLKDLCSCAPRKR